MSYATPPSATKDVGRVFDEGMRHSTLYWPNGDLVVSAQDSAGKTQLFRVHIATLAQHFPIFSAMLALPSGATSEAYDVFDVFYNTGFPLFKRDDPDFAINAYGLMKIATKYQVDSICKAIRNRLESEWPRTLEELVRFQNDMTLAKDKFISHPRAVHTSFPEPASAIRLATEFEIPSIFPAAYYILSTIDVDNDWDARSDTCRPGTFGSRPARFSLLRENEMLRYYQGRYRLMKEQGNLCNVLDLSYPQNCRGDWDEDTGSTKCWTRVDAIVGELDDNFTSGIYRAVRESCLANPIFILTDTYQSRINASDFCFTCTQLIKDKIFGRLRVIRDDLSNMFNLNSGELSGPFAEVGYSSSC